MEEQKKCRVCSVPLIVGENWLESSERHHIYVCRACGQAQSRKYRAENLERERERGRNRYNENIEHERKRNRIKSKKRRQTFRGKLLGAISFANRRASGVLTEEAALAIFEHQQHRCFYCRADINEVMWHLDHLVPVSRGGTNDPSNIVFACHRCNNAKNDSTAEEYLDWLSGVVQRWPELYKKLA